MSLGPYLIPSGCTVCFKERKPERVWLWLCADTLWWNRGSLPVSLVAPAQSTRRSTQGHFFVTFWSTNLDGLISLFTFRDTNKRASVQELKLDQGRCESSLSRSCNCNTVWPSVCMNFSGLHVCHVNEQAPHACMDELSHSTMMRPHFSHKLSRRVSSWTTTVSVIFCLDALFNIPTHAIFSVSVYVQNILYYFIPNMLWLMVKDIWQILSSTTSHYIMINIRAV